MATVVFGAIGAVIGGLTTYGAGAQLGWAIGAGIGSVVDSLWIGAVMRARSPAIQPPDVLRHPNADEGNGAPWVAGPATRVPGQVIFMSKVDELKTSNSEKGKGPENVVTEYFCDVAIAFARTECEGDPEDAIVKIWASGEPIYGSEFADIIIGDYSIKAITEVEEIDPANSGGCGVTSFIRSQGMRLRFEVPNGSQNDALLRSAGFSKTISLSAPDLHENNDGVLIVLEVRRRGLSGGMRQYDLYLQKCKITFDPITCTQSPGCVPAETQTGTDLTITQVLTFTDDVYFETPPAIYNGSQTQDPDPTLVGHLGPDIPAFRGTTYVVLKRFNITKWAGTLPQFEAEIRQQETLTLADGITRIITRSEAFVAYEIEMDASMSNAFIPGMFLVGPTSPADTLGQIFEIYNVEVQERSSFVTWQKAPISTLFFILKSAIDPVEIDEIETTCREEGSEGEVRISTTRTSKDDLPQELVLDFINRERALQPSTVSYQIRTSRVQNQQKFTTFLTMTPFQAEFTARNLLWKMIYYHDVVKFNLPPTRLDLVPGDRVDFDLSDLSGILRVRLTKTDVGMNGLMECEGQIDDELIEDQIPGGDEPDLLLSLPYSPPFARVVVMDIAPLVAEHAQTFGLYIAMRAGEFDGRTPTAVFYMSSDRSSWTMAAQLNAPATAGIADTVLAYAPPHYWDVQNTVDVIIDRDAVLFNATEEEVYKGHNWAYLGGEIIGFCTATLIEQGTYRLSKLLRCRNDSQFFADKHTIGEQFVLLPPSGAGVHFVPLPTATYQTNQWGRPVTGGHLIDDTEDMDVQFRPFARSIRPYRLHGIRSQRRESSQSICVYGFARTRAPYRLFSAIRPNMLESGSDNEYVADIYLPGPPEIFLRQVSACRTVFGDLGFTYTRAQQLADMSTNGLTEFPYIYIFRMYRLGDSIVNGAVKEWCVVGYGSQHEDICEAVL